MTGIVRRDFLNGAALTIAAGLTPAMQARGQGASYPPALGGLHGQSQASFVAAHALRDGTATPIDSLPVEESYDLVVAGGGISGLAAAWFYREAAGSSVRILILDSLEDFGGHAQRNEFDIGGRLILGYGGSESLQSPKALYSDTAKRLIAALGVDIARFETAFERDLYPSLGLSRGIFFPREAFGRDVLVPGDPMRMVCDDIAPARLNGRPLREFIADFPVSEASRTQLVGLFEQMADPLPGKTPEEKQALLAATSYRDYLVKTLGCAEEVADCFQKRTHDYFALGIDAVAASDARDAGYPGFAGLGLPDGDNPEMTEPYIYHFPDGNASLARLLVRSLIPAVASGSGMEDVVLARFDYGRLDEAGAPVRLRLGATCVGARDGKDGVDLAYIQAGTARRVRARHAVLACFNMMIPYMTPELPEAQCQALLLNVKAPLVYNKVAVRDWRPWVKLGVHEISCPMSFHSRVKLDYPVSLGGYRHSRDPSEPICLHMVHVPLAPGTGLDDRSQHRLGRQKLFETEFASFEAEIRDQLDRMLGPGGFSSGRDIAAITVNRWSHGYSHAANSLYDADADADTTIATARRGFGHVAIANSDAKWDPYAHSAIDEAARAVGELTG